MRPGYQSRGEPGRSGPPNRGPGNGGSSAPLDEATIRRIIDDGDARTIVDTAERLGQQLADGQLKTSQIRNVFGTVRRIEMAWPRNDSVEGARGERARLDLLMLRPKLAYQSARHRGQPGGEALNTLALALRPLIDRVNGDRARFQRFVDFFEAVLAYHRYHGGRD